MEVSRTSRVTNSFSLPTSFGSFETFVLLRQRYLRRDILQICFKSSLLSHQQPSRSSTLSSLRWAKLMGSGFLLQHIINRERAWEKFVLWFSCSLLLRVPLVWIESDLVMPCCVVLLLPHERDEVFLDRFGSDNFQHYVMNLTAPDQTSASNADRCNNASTHEFIKILRCNLLQICFVHSTDETFSCPSSNQGSSLYLVVLRETLRYKKQAFTL